MADPASSSGNGGAAVDQLERARERVRADVRTAMGFTREPGHGSFREGMATAKVGWYPLAALGALVIVDQFQGYAFFVLAPEIGRALGVSRAGLAGLTALAGVAGTLATLGVATLVQRRARRGAVAVTTGVGWSATTMLTAFVTNSWGLGAVLVGDAVTSASVGAVHAPLLIDSYPPTVRVRALALYRAAQNVGNIVSPLTVSALTALAGFTWRGVFLVMGIASLVAALFSVRLRDPGFGRWDSLRARAAVRGHAETGASTEVAPESVKLRFAETVRRLFLIPTIRRLLVADAVLGMLLVPLYTYTFFFLDERWGMGPGARGLFFAAMPLFSLAALSLFARRGEELFHRDPARVIRLSALLLGAGVVALALAIFSPVFALMVTLYGLAFALFAALGPALSATMLSIIPPTMRPHAAALGGIFVAGVGGFLGLVLLSGVDRRFGTGGAIASLALPGVAAALVFATAGRTVNADIDRMVDELVEHEQLQEMVDGGVNLPRLSCRGVHFSYGPLEVLSDVSLDVDEGEIVALLGTNGAGKSTLLSIIAGLNLADRGSVRFRGATVTYIDPERRCGLGIAHVAGEASLFPPLSVVEHLRLFAESGGGRNRGVEAKIDAAFEAFPALAARRDVRAGRLSGGEQQMLAVAKAVVTSPGLLLVDELSLGLAPGVVADLVEVIRRKAAEGTAVLVVEQMATLALSFADRAYFMDRGRICFAGPAAELRDRPDLLRSVFLAGAADVLDRR